MLNKFFLFFEDLSIELRNNLTIYMLMTITYITS